MVEKDQLKVKFATGKKPTGADFAELIDGVVGPQGEQGIQGLKGDPGSGVGNVTWTDVKDKPVEIVNITQKFTDIGQQLADTADQLESLDTANAKDVLPIINYLGNDQNIHPKVLHFPNRWNGYKYWMAYTPYPFGDTSAENPCIAASNNTYDWLVPSGLVNPLDNAPEGGYNSDTHLLYREDTNTMEIWWRESITVGSIWAIYRRTTTDGVNWSNEELILTGAPKSTTDLLSPSVIFEDGKYKLWSCLNGKVRYCESTDGTAKNWSIPIVLNIDWGALSAWHMDVIKTDLGYEMVVSAYSPGGNNNTADLYHVVQRLGGTFTKPKLILKRSKNFTAIDYVGIYRSSLLKIDGIYYLFYSSISGRNARGISLSSGADILGLNGFTDNDKHKPRIVRIYRDTVLTDYDVSNVDVIFCQAGTVTINSFKGGYVGKEILIIADHDTSLVKLNHSDRLNLPDYKSYEITKKQMGMRVVCISGSGINFKGYGVGSSGASTKTDRVVKIAGGTTLTDYDVSNVDAIIATGTAPVVVNSFVGGYVGQKVSLIVEGSVASFDFVYNGSRLVTPGLANHKLDKAKIGMDMMCTHAVNHIWRLY